MIFTLHHGDSPHVLAELPENSVDSVVTDPPYGLSFMGKSWDYDVPQTELWAQVLRVLKPGGHLLSFFGTRTYHRGVVRIEDAGFDIRDMIAWLYGSGFPKNPKVALKPALEPIVMARKALVGSIDSNEEVYGTGALRIDECRVGNEGGTRIVPGTKGRASAGVYGDGLNGARGELVEGLGRWPANVIHDGGDEATVSMGEMARYFYCAKASNQDRELGVRGDEREAGVGALSDNGRGPSRKNFHPTVKPTDLMRYLVRLVTPVGGTVLDPFMGSGSTGKACMLEGLNFIGIEREAEYVEIARARIGAAASAGHQASLL